ncbi:hypothetical protein ACGFNV_30675 [Streptomyces sp. NPDC048751]|uniref:hypothetical protein n=1 Tax=Streptomyces sp. NPDC048751 TaxID=3365591 RepID=UPI003717D6EA
MRKFAHAIGAGVAGLALIGAAQSSAQAAESVPSCVVGKPIYMVTIGASITNNCATTQQVNVKYSKGGVTYIPNKCHTVTPGSTVNTWEPVWYAETYVGLIPC